jgi:catechol 2,3-dioxygenase-like lactoylglutathione lyase family enzyme
VGPLEGEGVRLNQVTVGSVDLAASEEFYNILGLRLIVRDDRYLRFECPDGDSTFSIELVDAVPSTAAITIYFESDDIDRLCDRLIAQGVVLDNEPEDMPWLWREARLSDPDGHHLCIFRAGDTRRYPPWRISGDPSGVS